MVVYLDVSSFVYNSKKKKMKDEDFIDDRSVEEDEVFKFIYIKKP